MFFLNRICREKKKKIKVEKKEDRVNKCLGFLILRFKGWLNL